MANNGSPSLQDCREYSWEEFDKLELSEKNRLFKGDKDLFHTLNAEQFDRETLDRIYVLTNIRRLKRCSLKYKICIS